MVVFQGTSSNNFFYGSADDDVVFGGGSGHDEFYGFGGNDYFELLGLGSASFVAGGVGDDTYVINTLFAIHEYAGEGTDTVVAAFIDLASDFGGQSIENINVVNRLGSIASGNELDNVIRGDIGADALNGRNGNDTLIGGLGNDALSGSENDDLLIGGAGGDALDGGNGTDTASYAASDSAAIASLAMPVVNTGDAAGDTYVLVENLTGSRFSDTLIGNGGANVLDGGTGNDSLNGGLGRDMLIGGVGTDTYRADRVDEIIRETTAALAGGNDLVIYSGIGTFTLSANVERLALTHATANVNGVGNALANTIAGNNKVNVLVGKAGSDVLAGNGGVDFFVFDTTLGASNVDRIFDMTTADFIRLKTAIFPAIGASLNASEFARNGDGLAKQADDRLIYETDTGELYYDRNGSAAGGSVLVAILPTALLLTHLDFQMIA